VSVDDSDKARHLPDFSAEELVDLARSAFDGPGRIDTIMGLFGLSRCKDTWVGNQMIRGISGGERKRLSTVEMLSGPQRVLVLDEISTGLVRAVEVPPRFSV
jgi:ABC-type multidrug transport system ATPase subunit